MANQLEAEATGGRGKEGWNTAAGMKRVKGADMIVTSAHLPGLADGFASPLPTWRSNSAT
jgi:hypothetical protein